MNILITGTSRGLGFGLAKSFLEKGHTVYGISRNLNTELEVYDQFFFLNQDLSRFEETQKYVHQFMKSIKTLDLAILNAGVLSTIEDIEKTSLDEIKRVMDVNVWANKVLLDTLLETIGHVKQVVGISSGASVSGSRGWNAYALSKATLNMLLRLYAAERTETHFSALAPGIIDTQMQDYISSLPDDPRFPVVKRLKEAKGSRHMPDPENATDDIVHAIKSLLNKESGAFVDIRNL